MDAAYGTPSTPLLLPARPRPVHNPRPGAPLLARRGHGMGARWLVDEEDVSRAVPRHVHGMQHRRAGSSTRTTSRASRRRAGTRLRRTSASRWRPSCLAARRTARCAPLHRRPAARQVELLRGRAADTLVYHDVDGDGRVSAGELGEAALQWHAVEHRARARARARASRRESAEAEAEASICRRGDARRRVGECGGGGGGGRCR